MAYQAVLSFGMFGEDIGYMSEDFKKLSEEMKAKVDHQVKIILSESEARVEALLLSKGNELRQIAKNLYWYDYLDAKEMDKIFKGQDLDKEKVREWETEKEGGNKHG